MSTTGVPKNDGMFETEPHASKAKLADRNAGLAALRLQLEKEEEARKKSSASTASAQTGITGITGAFLKKFKPGRMVLGGSVGGDLGPRQPDIEEVVGGRSRPSDLMNPHPRHFDRL